MASNSAGVSSLNIGVLEGKPHAVRRPAAAAIAGMGQERRPTGQAQLAASGVAALINFPLWKASAVGQAGFVLHSQTAVGRYFEALRPPWRGAVPVVLGMTWARAAIFYGADVGRIYLKERGVDGTLATALPVLVTTSIVQIANMPLVRTSITLQDPTCPHTSVGQLMRHIAQTKGAGALWHGLSAGLFKAVPKYFTAVMVKQWMENKLAPVQEPQSNRGAVLARSAKKAVTAGLAGAVLTNPLDVIRNAMFRTDLGLVDTVKLLYAKEGLRFMGKGLSNNLIAVAIPVATTIWLADVFTRLGAT